MSYVIGVDTGGTFTDVAALDGAGRVVTAKAATTPENLLDGIQAGLESLAGALGQTTADLLSDTGVFRFSGTTAVNALLTRGGARTGLITTKGFEDTVAIARAMPGWAGLSEQQLRHAYRQRKPAPLVAKSLTRGVAERIDWSGDVVVELQEAELLDAADQLVAAGAEAIAVCFLWSVRNGTHEQRVRELISARHPGVFIAISHEVSTALGEYERFVSTVINAYVGPLLVRTIARLEERLRDQGFAGDVLVSQSDGGCLYTDETRPVYTLQSGPAAGVIAAQQEGRLLGYDNIISADVGGTSFDVGLVVDGTWVRATEPVVAQFHLSFPMVEIESIGAGGGSIAWVDDGGALNVGPQSAGARPGPAAYGLGGTQPTVTDADILLGFLNPGYFLGGRMRLDRALAERAVAGVADQLGLSVGAAAAGIFEISIAQKAALLNRRVLARGYDPRDFVLFAYGGAGATHSAFYAAELGVREVVVPALAGAFSAMGVATAPLLHQARLNDFAAMPMDADRFTENFQRLATEVQRRLDRNRVADEDRDLVYSVEMRYGLQMHTVRLEVPRQDYAAGDVAAVCDAFDRQYERLYGKGSGFSDAGRFLTSFTVDGYGMPRLPERARAGDNADRDAGAALVGHREVYLGGTYVPASVYRHELLTPGMRLTSPAIVEAPQTTMVVPPAHSAWIDPYLNVHIGIPDRDSAPDARVTAAQTA